MPNWRTRLNKVVHVVSEAAEVAIMATSNPGVVGLTATAAKLLNSVNKITGITPNDYFRRDGWRYHAVGFSPIILQMAKRAGFVHEALVSSERSGTVLVGTVHGFEVGWIAHDSWVDGPYVKDADGVDAALGRLLWEQLGTALKLEASKSGDRLVSDLSIDPIPSRRGDKLYETLHRYTTAGYTRSLLLLGDPGVGKSNLMRYIAKRAGGFSLRVRAKSLRNLADIPHTIELLRPSAVLIDDLDRLSSPEQILSEIEEIKYTAPLLICSVNDVSKLDPAVLRAGRFDERETIDRLDDEIVDSLIGDVPPDVAATLRALPVAWLNEFNVTREIEGVDVALARVQDLNTRHEEIMAMMKKQKADAEPILKAPSP